MANNSQQYDWQLIRREFRTGQFSDAELSRRHGCSRTAIQKHAAKEGWDRDQTEAVRQSTNAKLIREDARVAAKVAGCNAEDYNEVDLAAQTRIELVRQHRKDLSNMQRVEQALLADLENNPTKLYLAQFQGQIVEKVVGLTVTEKSQALQSLSAVQHKRQTLERIAFSMDADSGKPATTLQDIIDAIDGTTKGLPNG